MLLPEAQLYFTSHKRGGGYLAVELFNPSVHCKAAHQRQVTSGLCAAFIHIKHTYLLVELN